MIVGRKKSIMTITVKSYRYGLSNEELIDMGEPFFVGNSPYEGRVCIEVFGPDGLWLKSKDNDVLIVGEALDPSDDTELLYVLASRRQGEIWGRWYSKFCPDGELGFANYNVCTRIGSKEFEKMMRMIDQDVLDGTR